MREGGREGGRERRREGGREKGRDYEGGREGRKEEGRKGGREGERERTREGRREGKKEKEEERERDTHTQLFLPAVGAQEGGGVGFHSERPHIFKTGVSYFWTSAGLLTGTGTGTAKLFINYM